MTGVRVASHANLRVVSPEMTPPQSRDDPPGSPASVPAPVTTVRCAPGRRTSGACWQSRWWRATSTRASRRRRAAVRPSMSPSAVGGRGTDRGSSAAWITASDSGSRSPLAMPAPYRVEAKVMPDRSRCSASSRATPWGSTRDAKYRPARASCAGSSTRACSTRVVSPATRTSSGRAEGRAVMTLVITCAWPTPIIPAARASAVASHVDRRALAVATALDASAGDTRHVPRRNAFVDPAPTTWAAPRACTSPTRRNHSPSTWSTRRRIAATSVSREPESTPNRSSDCNRITASRTAVSASLSDPVLSIPLTLAATTDSPGPSDPFSRNDFQEL